MLFFLGEEGENQVCDGGFSGHLSSETKDYVYFECRIGRFKLPFFGD